MSSASKIQNATIIYSAVWKNGVNRMTIRNVDISNGIILMLRGAQRTEWQGGKRSCSVATRLSMLNHNNQMSMEHGQNWKAMTC